MPIETRSVKKKNVMGKSVTVPILQNSGAEGSSPAQNTAAMTSETLSTIRREKETSFGELPHTEVLTPVTVEDCDEDGGEGSDPPTRSFLRRRLDEQSRSIEQTFSRGIDKLYNAISSAGERHGRLLEMLVDKVYEDRPLNVSRQIPPRTNPPLVQAEPTPIHFKPIDLEKRGGTSSGSDGSNREVTPPVDLGEVQRMIDSALKKGPKFPKFIHPYPAYVEQFEYPKGFKIPDFSLFAGESSLSSLEHVARFTAQCGDVKSDFHKLRLFNFSLTGSAFAWYINLPPNSIERWEDLVEKFHEQFYRPGMEMSVSSLARMAQASDESPMEYLTRFKSARNWCRVPLPEVEFVRIALNGLDVEYKKKFLGANFRDMYELAQHVEQYDYLLREEKISKSPSRGTIYKNPTVSYASAEGEESQYANIDAAEIVIDKPYICKALTHLNPKDAKSRSAPEEAAIKASKVYTFDITKADAIFDQLLLAKIIKLRPGHNIPKAEELKGKMYCKYHNSNKHTTNNCVVFRDAIQSWIDKGKLKFPDKQMIIDADPFPPATVGMVDAHLPKNKGKGKVEFIPLHHMGKQGSQPRLKIDLFSNEPPTKSTGRAIVIPVPDSNSDLADPLIYSATGSDDSDGPVVLCSRCKANVTLPKQKRKSSQATTPQSASTAATTPPKLLGGGPRQKVFDRLGPQARMDGPTSVRRRLDFDVPFYDEDYHSRNSSSSSSSAKQRTFKPPETRDQRWYSYNSPTGVYTALSKSQKRRRQRIDCMARRQAAQATSATKWQPKEIPGDNDDRQPPAIMAESSQDKKAADHSFETTIEESEKRIKLLLRPGEMKARFEQFRKEAEAKLPRLPSAEPLIRVRRNLHPPFLGESLEYMREFHKKYSANDLYGLPKECQKALDLALTCPDAEQIIQKTTDPAMKARFQHIREARVLGFEVDPYTDIPIAELPFSLEDLQLLRYHFEVFSAVALFGLTAEEEKRVERLDAYLDTRNSRIAYEEQVRRSSQVQSEPDMNTPKEIAPEDVLQPPIAADDQVESPDDDNHDPMGPSVLENMEISMVHVLPAEFQTNACQPSSLDGDVVTEEATQVDFISVDEEASEDKQSQLTAALAELFPRPSTTALQHLKPLYVTAHIEGYPVSKVFVDCGATVNIMPVSVMRALRRSNDELIPSGVTMSSFVGDKSQTKGVLPLDVSIAGRNHMTAFFVVDSKTEYNALLGRDWIHQTGCIPSSLYQVLVFWDGKSVLVHPADNQPFATNMIQARYYDDHVGYITLQGFNEEGRPTRISVQKAIEVGAETVSQDSARFGLADLISDTDV